MDRMIAGLMDKNKDKKQLGDLPMRIQIVQVRKYQVWKVYSITLHEKLVPFYSNPISYSVTFWKIMLPFDFLDCYVCYIKLVPYQIGIGI